jgi:hypothetical protein
MLVSFRGQELELDPAGALWWPAREMLVVADLHLEKGTAMARRGSLLPPYDTHATLDRLEALLERRRPKTVVSLGDGFHDRAGAQILSPDLHDRLAGIVRRTSWLWICGNHDPCLPLGLGGAMLRRLDFDGLVFVHAPDGVEAGEIAGHLHPKARPDSMRFRRSRPCFVGDGTRLLLPAFGSYTGGLNVLDPAVTCLFGRGFTAYLLGENRVFGLPHHCLAAEPDAMQHRIGRA